MANASLLFLALLLTGCTHSNARHFWFSAAGITSTMIEHALADQPLTSDQNIRVINLGVADSASHHLVQVRHSEPLHIHRYHDLSVWIYRGSGRMQVGTNFFSVNPGDTAYIPRAIPHRFVNEGKSPAIAIVVFSPSLTDRDFKVVEGE